MSQQSEIIKKVAQAANLDSVLLKSSSSDIFIEPDIVSPEIITIAVDYSFNSEVDQEEKVLLSIVAVNVKGVLKEEYREKNSETGSDDNDVFFCKCSFVGKYSLNAEITEEEADQFTEVNALFNVYPYLREHVSSTCLKMGLSGIFLPLLKRQPKVKSLEKPHEK